jgi:DNA-binding TFAR19-related protein (PDSD5 family)
MTRLQMLRLVRKVIACMYEKELVSTKTASKLAQKVNKWQEVAM